MLRSNGTNTNFNFYNGEYVMPSGRHGVIRRSWRVIPFLYFSILNDSSEYLIFLGLSIGYRKNINKNIVFCIFVFSMHSKF